MKDKKLIALLSISILLIILIGVFRPHEIDWSPTFRSADKIPYGGYVLYHSLPQLFGNKPVTLNTKQPYDYDELPEKKTSYCFIQSEFNPSPTNAERLLDLANTGNDIFVSSTYIRGAFLDSLKFRQSTNFGLARVVRVLDNDSVYAFNANFTNPGLRTDSGYWYRRAAGNYYYNLSDSDFLNQGIDDNSPISEATVLGTDGDGHANFILIHFGAGRIFLHNNPYAFTNYYMLKAENAEYISKCFSYLEGDAIVWDEYFKQREEGADQSTLRFVLSREPLRWAYYTFLASLLFFVAFNIKRRQRIIPVNDPYRNTSLEFARLVGGLYYNQGDHKNIMVKKINYLLEFIRNRYNLDTHELNPEFCDKLSAKTGIEPERILHLLNLLQGVQRKNLLGKHELIELNNAIQYFKTHCQ